MSDMNQNDFMVMHESAKLFCENLEKHPDKCRYNAGSGLLIPGEVLCCIE